MRAKGMRVVVHGVVLAVGMTVVAGAVPLTAAAGTPLAEVNGEAITAEEVDEALRGLALRYRVALLRAANGVPVDVALGAMPFEERALARARDFSIEPGVALTVCSAEDLIALKAFAGRERGPRHAVMCRAGEPVVPPVAGD